MYQLPSWVWPATLFVICALAVWRGGLEERLAAGANLLAWVLTRLVFADGSELIQWPVLAIDTAFLVLLMWIALRTRRHWPLFAAGFQLLGVVTHLARAADAGVSGWAYLTAALLWNYLVLYAIGYGAWTAPRYARAAAEDAGATRR